MQQYDLHHIDWLMSCIDAERALDRLGVKDITVKGDEIWARCPDHHLFTNHESSHPKWSLNTTTGFTKCFTEGRGSNLLWIVKRIKKLGVRETIEWLLEDSLDSTGVKISRLQRSLINLVPNSEIHVFDANKFSKQLKSASISSRAVSFLARHCIHASTARSFECVDFTAGYYRDRLIFPIKTQQHELVGFVATNMLNKEEWLQKNTRVFDRELKNFRRSVEGDYRKVVYPGNFKLGNNIMGIDSVEHSTNIIFVEGCRDLMKLRQEGFTGALSLGGTNISSKQVELVSRLTPQKIIIMFDGDEAGRNATTRVASSCMRFFSDVFGVFLPKNKDPKDLNREEVLFYMKNSTQRFLL